MDLKVINERGKPAATVVASDALFGRDFNESLVHQVVVAYQANARLATRKQKARGEVNRSHRKPWRQKGTGRARAGFSGSPLWRGGGRIFPSSPDENFTQKLNKKMYRAGVASILSQLAREDRLKVVESFVLDAPKTKLFLQKVTDMGVADSLLLITDQLDDNLVLSSRNLPNVLVLEVAETDPVSLIRYQNVILTRKAVSKFEEMLG